MAERVLWKTTGEVVTVIERKLRHVQIRDSYGFVVNVRKRDLQELREDDERRTFST